MVHTVTSSTDRATKYAVDLDEITCTCPDFTRRRGAYPTTDPRRLCKHLLSVIHKTETIPTQLAAEKGRLNRLGWRADRGFPIARTWATVRAGRRDYDIYLPLDARSEWVEVITDGARYSFSLFEERWSYGEAPYGAGKLGQAILNFDRAQPAQTEATPEQNAAPQKDGAHGKYAPLPPPSLVQCRSCNMEYTPADIAGLGNCPVCNVPFAVSRGGNPKTTMAFRNPANGHVERLDGVWAWVLLLGCIYFAAKGVWTHAVAALLAAIVTGGLSWLVYPFFAERIMRTHYLRMGWVAA